MQKKTLNSEVENEERAFKEKLANPDSEEEKQSLTKALEKEREKWSRKMNKLNKLDVVVFFDEANTTDAIGLIKEIMCDRRMNGRPISADLKFIAACNPYRK